MCAGPFILEVLFLLTGGEVIIGTYLGIIGSITLQNLSFVYFSGFRTIYILDTRNILNGH